MTEHEWLTADDPEPMMIELIVCVASDRKLRLFAVACCRRIEHMLTDVRSRAALEFLEQFAEGKRTQHERDAVLRSVQDYADDFAPDEAVACALLSNRFDVAQGAAEWSTIATGAAADMANRESGRAHIVQQARARERAQQTDFLREIFGNPFRPVAFDPAWRTDTALTLARQMYDSREFGAMPILADALQDAGCDNEAILNHCRDATTTHVRGCWVLDLVLGKE